jgi:hypothetical protein
VGQQSDSVDLLHAEQLHKDDLISDAGSVVYVDTDDEEESFSNLRSWAADGALTASQTTYVMSDSYRENDSMQSSFHSTISERQQTPQPQETVVYKTWTAEDSIPAASTPTGSVRSENAAMEASGSSEALAAAEPERPVPVNGSSQLPINLNAMKSIEEQNLFRYLRFLNFRIFYCSVIRITGMFVIAVPIRILAPCCLVRRLPLPTGFCSLWNHCPKL